MTRLSPILGPDGRPLRVRQATPVRVRPRASYDAAGDGDDNRRHWQQADGLSANAANSSGVRDKLRRRSRYEFDNNGYANGLITTLANDLVGTGPVLQVQADETVARGIEERWKEWCVATGFTDDLHTLKQAKTRDGEGMAHLVTNPAVPDAVQLDLDVFEAEQCTTPWSVTLAVDGIEQDAARNPVAYYILHDHPGESFTAAGSGTWDRVPAADVLHWFRRDRPRQMRGVPEVTASLPLFAQLRRYTLATLTAAEVAASFAAMLETDAGANDDTGEPTPFETLEIERGMMTTLPAGAKMHQLDSKHPTTTYPDFKKELLKEIGRPCNAPFNVVSGDSSPYNYSSARLDHLLYRGALRVERDHCRRHVLDRVFAAWYAEARLIAGHLPAGSPDTPPPHAWYWPGYTTIDPQKESAADAGDLANATTTLAELLAEHGQDWRAFLEQRAKEMELMESLGLPLPVWLSGTPQPAAGSTDTQAADPQDDTVDQPPPGRNGYAHRNGYHRGAHP